MSIKLYDSYKLPKMSLNNFFSLIPKLKEAVLVEQKKIFRDIFLTECIHLFDHKTFNPKMEVVFGTAEYFGKRNAASIVSDKLNQNQKSLRSLDIMDSFYFHANFMFHRGHIYCVTRSLSGKYHKYIQSVMGGVLYEYWDNTDRPSGITPAKWAARRREWDGAFKNKFWDSNRGAAVKVEFPFSVRIDGQDAVSGEFPKDLLTREDRVKSFAEINVLDKKFKDTFFTPDKNDLGLNRLLDNKEDSAEVGRKTISFMISDEFRSLLKVEVDRLMSLVKKDLTMDKVISSSYEVVRDITPRNPNNDLVIRIDTF